MDLYDFFNASLMDKLIEGHEYIVKLKYGYKDINEYFISNEVLLWDYEIQAFYWVNDWWEGQDYIECMGYINIEKIEVPSILDSIK